MRRAAKVDATQAAIVETLRAAGATVTSLAAVGDGCPDLLVGWRAHNLLLEVKDGSLAPSARALTPPQKKWHREWKGRAHVVNSVEDALLVLTSAHYL